MQSESTEQVKLYDGTSPGLSINSGLLCESVAVIRILFSTLERRVSGLQDIRGRNRVLTHS